MRWFGNVGYAIAKEIVPGVYKPQVVSRQYSGDAIELSSRWQNSQNQNDNLTLDVKISIIADPFAYENFAHIVYVEYMNSKWKVTSAKPNYPRIELTVGGVYNEKQTRSTQHS